MTTLAELRRVPLLDGLSEGELGRVLEEGSEKAVRAGEVNGREGEPVEDLYVILSGELRITKKTSDGGETVLNVYTSGAFFAEVPLLAGTPFMASGRALTDCRLFLIPNALFRQLLTENASFGNEILRAMAERVQILQSVTGQREKLDSLSTLAAGLAHELNNPAAATRRTSEELGTGILAAQLRALEHDARFSPVARERLIDLLHEVAARPVEERAPLSRSDAEDDLATWLEDRDVDEAWDLAPILVAAGVEGRDLEVLSSSPEDLPGAVRWLADTMELTGLTQELSVSVGHISHLVGAMKEYTFMDRATPSEDDVVQGLENTLTILGHKLKGVSVVRDFEDGLPKVPGHGGELNQVWTNLLDNAADAVAGGGSVGVRAFQEEEAVVVEVADDGPGIPPGIKNRVFEPFFTTKEVGSGAGLGLDVARRVVVGRGGDISVESGPEGTRFVVRLPLEIGTRNGG